MSIRSNAAETDALEARLGGALASALSAQALALPHDLAERLRAGREQALARVRTRAVAVKAATPATLIVGRMPGRVALLGDGPSWGVRLASALPLLLLLAGLLAIERWNDVQQVHAAAEIDAMLLADDLPPAAYADPGFGEFLRSPRPDQP